MGRVRAAAATACVLLWACIGPDAISVCDSGRVCPDGLVCLDAFDSCVPAEEFFACDGRDGEVCERDSDVGLCDRGACTFACGDGLLQDNAGEACDDSTLPTCASFGFYQGETACSDCQVDTSGCSEFCGDDVLNGQELCEPGTYPDQCTSLGFSRGRSTCPDCSPELTDCQVVDWQGLPTTLTFVDFDGLAEDRALGITTDSLYYWDGLTWRRDLNIGSVLESELVRVVAMADGNHVVVGTSGWLYTSNAGVWSATQVTAGGYAIAAAWGQSSAELYFAVQGGTEPGIFVFDGTEPRETLDIAGAISIQGRGPTDIYALIATPSYDSQLWHFDGSDWTHLTTQDQGGAQELAVTTTDVYARINDDVYRLDSGELSLLFSGNNKKLTASGPVAFSFEEDYLFRIVGASHEILPRGEESPLLFGKALGPWRLIGLFSGENEPHLWDGVGYRRPSTSRPCTSFCGPSGTLRVAINGIPRWDGTRLTVAGSGIVHESSGDSAFRRECDGNCGLPFDLIDLWPYGTDDYVYANPTTVGFSPGGAQPIPATATWTELAVLGNLVWVSGFDDAGQGVIAHYDGLEWTASTVASELYAIAQADGLPGVAVGLGGAIFEQSGEQWLAVSSPTTETLRAVSYIDGVAYAVGDGGTLVRRDSEGWTQIPLPSAAKFTEVAGTGADDLVLSSLEDSLHFDGANWSDLRINQFLPDYPVIAMPGWLIYNPPENIIMLRRYKAWSACAAVETDCGDREDDDCDGLIDGEDAVDCP